MKHKANTTALREEIARLINHGLSDREVFSHLVETKNFLWPTDLIAVIRDLMTQPETRPQEVAKAVPLVAEVGWGSGMTQD